MLRHYWLSPAPQPTVTRGWCRVMKRRSTLPTPSVTAVPLFVYPCIPRNPTPNAWNFAVPIHPVIHIWPLPLLLWLLWMEFKMKNEVEPMDLRPHPYEFALYYDM